MIGVLRRLSRYRPQAVVETAAAAEGRLGLLAQVAATWCVLAALDLALNLTLPESGGRSGLPLPARLAAVLADLAGLTLALLAAVGAGLLVGRVGGRFPFPVPVRAMLLGRRPVLVWVNRALYMVVQTPLAHQYALVRGPYKLIFDVRGGRYLLFDLSRDPEERSDLAPSRPDLLEALADRLLAWRDAQVDYYARPARYTREYPPILDD